MNKTMPDYQPASALNRISALVTRPRSQGTELAGLIHQQGGKALSLPMLDIRALPESQAIRDQILSLDRYDKIIVISKHAARFGMELIESYWPQMPVHQQWFAIGETTRQTLANFDVAAICSDQGNDSESLLSLGEFRTITSQNILLIKGTGGRDFLEQALLKQGANVDSLEVYQRICPDYPPDEVRQQLAEHGINVILAGSGETVQNLHHYLPLSVLEQCRLVVPGQRVASVARELGFKQVYTAEGADHAAMLSVLKMINNEISL